MLTIKQINEDKEAVIRGLEKKKFTEARAAIDAVLAADGKRKSAQRHKLQSKQKNKPLKLQRAPQSKNACKSKPPLKKLKKRHSKKK